MIHVARLVAVVAVGLLTGCAYQTPIAPSVVIPDTPRPEPTVIVAPTPIVPASAAITIDLSATPFAPHIGDAVSFTVTTGNGVAPFTYAWTFGDGSSSAGSETTRTHVYASDGVKMIRVTATDSQQRSASGSREIVVPANRVELPPPVPAPPPPPPPPTPAPTLSAALNCTPPAVHDATAVTPCNVSTYYNGSVVPSGKVSSVAWDFGDGQTNPTGSVTATHTYPNAGSYVVVATVTATTEDGVKTATTSQSVTVK